MRQSLHLFFNWILLASTFLVPLRDFLRIILRSMQGRYL